MERKGRRRVISLGATRTNTEPCRRLCSRVARRTIGLSLFLLQLLCTDTGAGKGVKFLAHAFSPFPTTTMKRLPRTRHWMVLRPPPPPFASSRSEQEGGRRNKNTRKKKRRNEDQATSNDQEEISAALDPENLTSLPGEEQLQLSSPIRGDTGDSKRRRRDGDNKNGRSVDQPSSVDGTTIPPDTDNDEHDFMIWKVNASDAFGSMLLQMQSTFQPSQEQENKGQSPIVGDPQQILLDKNDPRASEFLLQDDDLETVNVVDGDEDWVTTPTANNPLNDELLENDPQAAIDSVSEDDGDDPTLDSMTKSVVTEGKHRSLTTMTVEMAKELDEAVLEMPPLPQTGADNTNVLEEVDVPPIYQDSGDKDSLEPTTSTRTPPPSVTEDYVANDELRRVALGVASRTDSVETWCETVAPQIGGIYPLLVSIRKGAEAHQQELAAVAAVATTTGTASSSMTTALEEASQACRVLRDLCGLSSDLATVVVDSIVRAITTDQKLASKRENEQSNHQPLHQALLDRLHGPRQEPDLLKDFATLLQNDADPVIRLPQPPSGAHVANDAQRKLYVLQLLLAMCVASDYAIQAIRNCSDLKNEIIACSSYASTTPYANKKKIRRNGYQLKAGPVRWVEGLQQQWRKRTRKPEDGEEAAKALTDDKPQSPRHQTWKSSDWKNLNGEIRKTANQVLAAIG